MVVLRTKASNKIRSNRETTNSIVGIPRKPKNANARWNLTAKGSLTLQIEIEVLSIGIPAKLVTMLMAKRGFASLSVATALVLKANDTSSSACESPRNKNGGTVKEPFTGIEFPRIREDVDHKDYLLVGTAVRCMLGQCKFAKARAYAVGLYVEDGNQVDQWMPKGVQNSNKEVIFSQLLRAPVARRLVLVMDKDVAGHHIAKGFDRSLLPRVRKAQGGLKSGPGKDALRDFTRCFNEEKMLHKGTEVSLVWRPDDLLIISINSSVRAMIPSPILCHALFDMYLGPDSIFKKYRNMSFTLVEMTDF